MKKRNKRILIILPLSITLIIPTFLLIVDAPSEGYYHSTGLDTSFNRIISSKTPVFLILRSCLIQLQQLDLMRTEVETKNKRASQVMAEMGRFIHFKRKPVFEKALNKWSCQKLRLEMDKISNAILETRRNAALETSITRQALMRVCLLSR